VSKSRWGVRSKLVALAIAVSAIPLAAVGLALLDVNGDELRLRNQEILAAVVDDITAAIDRSFDDVEATAESVARALTDPQLADELRVPVALAAVSSAEGVEAVGIYDQEGRAIDTIREVDTNDRLPDTLGDDVRQAALARSPAIASPDVGPKGPRVLLVVPVRGADVTWFAAAHASLALVQERVEGIAVARFGNTDSAVFAVDDALRAVAHSDAQQSQALSSMKGHPALVGVSGASLGAGIELFGEFDGPAGTVVAAVRSLDRVPWAVVAETPRDVAYASLERARAIVLGVIALAIIGAALAATWLSRRLTAPIDALVSQSNALAARQFDARVDVHTGDELAVLGQAMNRAAQELGDSEDKLRTEAEIRADLSRYLPGQLVDRIVDRDEALALGGERKNITVIFADVAAFTPLAESQNAEDVVAILNQLFTVLTEVVFRHGGTVDKFIGDCVMAFWGAPTPQTDHARRALSAAEDMLRWLDIANERWIRDYGVTIHLAIGVHTGEAIVGNFGSKSRMEYTAVGDTVNVAARLESIARPQQILATEQTRRAAGPGFHYEPLGAQQLAGRLEPVELHEVRP